MKKTLLSTAAALTLMSAAAQAGPALDALTALLPPDAQVSFDAERAEAGQEGYTGLEVKMDGVVTRFELARLTLEGDLFGLDGERVRSTDGSGTVTELDRVAMSAPAPLLKLGVLSAEAPVTAQDDEMDLCAAARSPLALSADGLRLDGAGTIGTFRLDAAFRLTEGVCTLELSQSLSDLDIRPDLGVGVRVGSQEARIRTPLVMGLPEAPTGDTYGSDLSVRDVEIFIDGSAELRVREISSASAFEADSGLPLVAAGYNRHLLALSTGLGELDAPDEQLPYADLWNGARAINTTGSVRVLGAEVTGDRLATLLPVPGFLDRGAGLDLELSLTKAAELMSLAVRVDGTSTLLLDLAGTVRVEEADPSFNALSPRALVMAAPLSLVSGSVRFSDRGAGAAAERAFGADPYALVTPSLTGLIGAENATRVSDWVETARNGGEARVFSAPTEPVPVLMLGLMGLGDWAQLGALLNVSTGVE